MLKISRTTRLSNATGLYFLRDIHREEAERLLAGGLIEADETRGQRVVSFRLTSKRAPISVQVGSFGVNRLHVPVGSQYGLSGGIVFSHRNTYEDLAA